jgi:hypothetical protein
MLTTIHSKRQISVQYVIVLVYKPTYIICHCACIVSQPANEECKIMPYNKKVLEKAEHQTHKWSTSNFTLGIPLWLTDNINVTTCHLHNFIHLNCTAGDVSGISNVEYFGMRYFLTHSLLKYICNVVQNFPLYISYL